MINDYTTLVAESQDYLQTPRLNSKIDLYIQQTETELNSRLRHPDMEAEQQVTLTSNVIPLPADFLQLRQIDAKWPRGIFTLEAVTPEVMDRASFSEPGRPPQFYTLEKGEYKVHPSAADSELTILYYQKIPALTVSNTTNWIILRYPMLYWYGVLHKAWEWKMDDSQIQRYRMAFLDELREVELAGKRQRYRGQGLAIRGV